MKKSQIYALVGFIVGVGAPFGALFLKYLTLRPFTAPVPFVDTQWADSPFFYWYMLISTCLVLSTLGYFLGRLEDREKKQRGWLEYRAQLDPVTGVLGPVKFHVLTRSVWESFRGKGQFLSAAAIQINGFKELNQKHGHSFGLNILQDIAWLLHFCVREGDLVSRLEDAVFICLLPRCDGTEASSAVQRLQDSLKSQTFHSNGERVHINVSAGIATLDSPQGKTLQDLFDQALEALVQAKQKGTGQIHSYSPNPLAEPKPHGSSTADFMIN